MGMRGVEENNTSEADVQRAAERVTLACRALQAGVRDLRLAYVRSGTTAVDDAADQLSAETEKICELSEQLVKLGRNLAVRPLATAGRGD